MLAHYQVRGLNASQLQAMQREAEAQAKARLGEPMIYDIVMCCQVCHPISIHFDSATLIFVISI